MVLKYLKRLKDSTSLTSENIPQVFFKLFSEHLAEPLSHIYNLSLYLGEVPKLWKISFVIPIPKSNTCTTVINFRPISILPTSSKILEKIIKNDLISWLFKLKYIPNEQHGFLPGSSTCTQLLDCNYAWINALTSSKYVTIVYFDLTKAFDMVCHSSLLKKLCALGIKGNMMHWFEPYFENRCMLVKFSNFLISSVLLI